MPYIKQLITRFIFWLFFAAIISCKNQISDNTEVSKVSFTKIETSDNPAAYGEWTMCSYATGNQITQFYICPTILLNENGSGELITSNVLSTTFNWALKNDILTIAKNGNINPPFFSNGIYKAFITYKDNQFNLIIIDSVYTTKFYLSE